MNSLYCINCEENVTVSEASIPECPNCWGDDFKEAEVTTVNNNLSDNRSVKSIELIYQSNFEKIKLDFSNNIQILGRRFVGSKVLSKIMVNNGPVISGKHCQIEFKANENSFFVQDLNSTNGTFVDDKNAKNEVLLEDQSVLKLGREIFVASFIYEEISKNVDDSEKVIIETEVIKEISAVFYCPDCSANYENDGYCSECDVKLRKN